MELPKEQKALLEQEAIEYKDRFNRLVSRLIPQELHLQESYLKGAQSILSDPGRWGLCSDNDVRSESWKWAKHTVELEKQHDAALMRAASELVSLEDENTRLKTLMQEFISAIDSDEITLKENYDNDGWENCGGRLYDRFKQALEGVDK